MNNTNNIKPPRFTRLHLPSVRGAIQMQPGAMWGFRLGGVMTKWLQLLGGVARQLFWLSVTIIVCGFFWWVAYLMGLTR